MTLKATYDDRTLAFYAQTKESITPCTDPMWMLLLLDTDQDGSTGWLGYDLVVNETVGGDNTTTVKAWRNGACESLGEARYGVAGTVLEIAIPRALLGDEDAAPAFDFHWADNIQGFGDVSELGLHGDSAPNRRWNYRYSVRGE